MQKADAGAWTPVPAGAAPGRLLALAPGLLAAALLWPPAPASAQPTTVTFLTNLGETAEDNAVVGGSLNFREAVRFVVGSENGPFLLEEVVLDVASADAGARPVVKLHNNNQSGTVSSPGTLIATFEAPSDFGTGRQAFRAPRGEIVRLGRRGSYWLSIESASTPEEFRIRYNANKEAHAGTGSRTGWAIHGRATSNTPAWPTPDLAGASFRHIRVEIRGRAPVWAASLTPGTSTTGVGYISPGTGSLDDTAFTYRSTDYTIPSLYRNVSRLFLNTTPTIADDSLTVAELTLWVGNAQVHLSDANQQDFSGTTQFSWLTSAISGFSLTDGTAVNVALLTRDATGPRLLSATVSADGTAVTLAFDKNLSGQLPVPADSGLTISDGTSQFAVASLAVQNSTELLVGLASVIAAGATVTVSYADPTAADDTLAIQDTRGNDAASFTTGAGSDPAVTNSSTVIAAPVVTVEPVPRTPTSLRVLWTVPASGSATITGYDIRYTTQVNFNTLQPTNWIDGPQGVAGTSAVLQGLRANAYHHVQVRASAGGGVKGPWSATFIALASPTEADIPANHFAVPAGVGPGESFRALYVSIGTTRATEAAIDPYGDHLFVATDATYAAGNVGESWFDGGKTRALVSTPGVGARLHTDTTWDPSDRGVPIYWLLGAKVADDYEDFYDGSWDNETDPRNELGNPRPLAGSAPWTGSDHDGTELFDGTVSRAMGQPRVGVGAPDSTITGAGPIRAGPSFPRAEERPLYGLTSVYHVTDIYRFVSNSVTATSATSDDRAARRSQAFTAGSHPAGYALTEACIDSGSGEHDTFAVAVHTANSQGVPGTLHADLSPPDSFSGRITCFTAPAGTVLDSGSNYALVVTVDTAGTDLLLQTESDDDESPSSLAGWSIADAFRYESGSSWTEDTGGASLEISVFGRLQDAPAPPELESATVDAAGTSLTLVFDEDLDLSAAGSTPLSSFTVTADGAAVSVSLSPTDPSQPRRLVLGLAAAVGQGQAVVVSYADPSTADDTMALQDADGNDVASFTTGQAGVPAVTNSSTTVIAANTAPVFGQSSVTFEVDENTAANRPIGTAVSATDADDDSIEYSLRGDESAPFAIDASNGQISTKDPLDYEAKSSYVFQVRADDSNGGSDTAAVTITIRDIDEPPGIPDGPSVTATPGSDTSLDVSWTAPANTGPPVSGYDLQYRAGTSGAWINGPQDVSGTSTTIPDLAPDRLYQVQLRASNAEGDSPWSNPPGSGRTNAPGNRAPAFPGSSTTRQVPENSQPDTPVGEPLTATDPDTGDTLTYSLEGDDAGAFAIDSASGQVRTRAGVAYDHEARSRYAVVVKVDDSAGGTDTIAVTVRITDEREPPAPPGSPVVSPVPGSATSLEATWTPRATPDRPHVTGYDVQYRKSGDTEWNNGPQNRPSARAEITGLEAGTDYDVQVRATNAEGDSDWSGPGPGRTHALAARVVQAPARHDGSASFTVQVQFSEEITIDDQDEFRDDAASAVGGSVTAARRLAGNRWEVTLEPDSDGAVVVSLSAGGGCSVPGALCSAGGAPLSHDLEHAVPGPDTAVVTIRAVSSAVTEGSPAVFELRRSGAPVSGPLPLSLASATSGHLFADSPPGAATFQAGSATVRVEVDTVDDSIPEPGGYVLVRIEPDSASPPDYVLGARAEAAVQVRDNDGGQPPPVPPVAGAQRAAASASPGSALRNPQPLQLALWTDRPGYRSGETVRLYRTLDPHDERGRYRTFVYLEQAGGGQRRYLAPLYGQATLRAEFVDHRGVPAGASTARSLLAAGKALVWEGPAPEIGLWQFVMDLRPEGATGPDEEIDPEREADRGIRRAWAKFAVARHGQLLNRRNFDREITSDLTLRSDTLYFLRHQLFVRAGATLTIEPGTVVQAYGRSAAIIVERGGRIVAGGTRAAPVVLTCSLPAGQREPGCWGGLRILGKAPVTRLEGLAGGVLPPDRPVYGGTDPRDSSGTLRYVRVEFAGAGAESGTSAPAIGFHGVGDGTAIEYLQAHASLGPGIAFAGGTAACDHCVASGSGAAGLAWERGWRGSASHLYVQHANGGAQGIDGASDDQGWDLEPRSLPTLANVTLVHSYPYGKREREAAGLRLRTGSGVTARDLLVTRFGGGAIDAGQRAALLFEEGVSSVSSSLLYRNGFRPLRGSLHRGTGTGIEFTDRDPKLRDVRYVPNPDPRLKPGSRALKEDDPELPQAADGEADPDGEESEEPAEPDYIGAFGKDENWLEEWTLFGPEADYDTRAADGPP